MVDRDWGVVAVPDSKNDDPQAMPLDDELLEIINGRWEALQKASACAQSRARMGSNVVSIGAPETQQRNEHTWPFS